LIRSKLQRPLSKTAPAAPRQVDRRYELELPVIMRSERAEVSMTTSQIDKGRRLTGYSPISNAQSMSSRGTGDLNPRIVRCVMSRARRRPSAIQLRRNSRPQDRHGTPRRSGLAPDANIVVQQIAAAIKDETVFVDLLDAQAARRSSTIALESEER